MSEIGELAVRVTYDGRGRRAGVEVTRADPLIYVQPSSLPMLAASPDVDMPPDQSRFTIRAVNGAFAYRHVNTARFPSGDRLVFHREEGQA